ncbi:hypothetical protein JAAARDRAFT_43161 [Jaapia argillacea MUCL 33604]|uniref:DUF4100 domain-containing protein n=1 Tax=Jaapia argillacea MUCL 33604 TaxID=933084 RepID=A0A067PER1_9AGAM|nr:hypothetical protein JAAARDRAFT_43161 [Jaapia argillacea MUCL 33604]
MKDRTTGDKAKSYRFTSDVQESVSIEEIQRQILDTSVTLPLRSILATSPELRKRIVNLTKTRREYTTKQGESSI